MKLKVKYTPLEYLDYRNKINLVETKAKILDLLITNDYFCIEDDLNVYEADYEMIDRIISHLRKNKNIFWHYRLEV